MHDQFILVSFVIAIGHGLYGGNRFLDGGWWLGVDFLLRVGLVDLFMQVLSQLLMLLGLLFCGLGGYQFVGRGHADGFSNAQQ